MVDYSTLIYDLVIYMAPSIIVFLMLALILDYMRQMLFSNR